MLPSEEYGYYWTSECDLFRVSVSKAAARGPRDRDGVRGGGERRSYRAPARQAYAEVGRISDLVSFEPDIVPVHLDGVQLHLASGQTVIPHGPDRDLDVPIPTGKQP
jgi:hypothetical protein